MTYSEKAKQWENQELSRYLDRLDDLERNEEYWDDEFLLLLSPEGGDYVSRR